MVKAKYPNIQKIQFNQILGRIWTEMPEQERNKYEAKADYLAQLQASGQKAEVEVVEQKPVTPKKKLGRPKKKKEMTPGKVYSMELPNSDIGRIFIQRVDGPESSPAAGGLPAPAPSAPTPWNTTPTIEDKIAPVGRRRSDPPYLAPSEPPAKVDQPGRTGSELHKEVVRLEGGKRVTVDNLEVEAKNFPMFPLYFKNMRSSLRRIFDQRNEQQLKLKAFQMFQEMVASAPTDVTPFRLPASYPAPRPSSDSTPSPTSAPSPSSAPSPASTPSPSSAPSPASEPSAVSEPSPAPTPALSPAASTTPVAAQDTPEFDMEVEEVPETQAKTIIEEVSETQAKTVVEKVPETQEKTSDENKPAERVKYETETKNKIIPKESNAKEAVGADPYLYFCQELRPMVGSQYPSLSQGDVQLVLAKMWKSMSNHAKARYYRQAAQGLPILTPALAPSPATAPAPASSPDPVQTPAPESSPAPASTPAPASSPAPSLEEEERLVIDEDIEVDPLGLDGDTEGVDEEEEAREAPGEEEQEATLAETVDPKDVKPSILDNDSVKQVIFHNLDFVKEEPVIEDAAEPLETTETDETHVLAQKKNKSKEMKTAEKRKLETSAPRDIDEAKEPLPKSPKLTSQPEQVEMKVTEQLKTEHTIKETTVKSPPKITLNVEVLVKKLDATPMKVDLRKKIKHKRVDAINWIKRNSKSSSENSKGQQKLDDDYGKILEKKREEKVMEEELKRKEKIMLDKEEASKKTDPEPSLLQKPIGETDARCIKSEGILYNEEAFKPLEQGPKPFKETIANLKETIVNSMKGGSASFNKETVKKAVEAVELLTVKPLIESLPKMAESVPDQIREKEDVELKSLIGALVTSKTPDRDIIKKIVSRTRAGLKLKDGDVVGDDMRATRASKPDENNPTNNVLNQVVKKEIVAEENEEDSSTKNVALPVLYCYCRSPSSKDLIGCDFCSEWYHPACLQLGPTELQMVLALSNWKCPECIKKTVREKDEQLAREKEDAEAAAILKDKDGVEVAVKPDSSPALRARGQSKSCSRLPEVKTFSSPSGMSSLSSPSSLPGAELASLVMKERGEEDCRGCGKLVEEVRRRGEVIQSMARRVRALEEAAKTRNGS